MTGSAPIRFGFETRPESWIFPAGPCWVTGWLAADPPGGAADVRLWVGRRIILGVPGLPAPATAPGDALGFAFRFDVSSPAELRFEIWQPGRGWVGFFRAQASGTPTAGSLPAPVSSATRLARYARAFLRQPSGEAADALLQSTWAEPLDLQPSPPFFGALETPTDDGYLRHGRLLVSGWLAHRSQAVRRVTARVGGGPAAVLVHGWQRRDVGEQFPELVASAHSHFVGEVVVPADLPEPALLLVSAETETEPSRAVFARRFLPWDRTRGAAAAPARQRASRLRLAWSLGQSARRHGVRWSPAGGWSTVLGLRAAAERAARTAAAGAFAESTPLSLYLSSFEDHEVRPPRPAPGPRQPWEHGRNLLFVLHCDFSWASAYHVLALAHELDRRGFDCIAAVPQRLDTLADHEDPACRGVLHAGLGRSLTFLNGRGPDLVHAWTTREMVRIATARVRAAFPAARLVVHLEDHEAKVLEISTGLPLTQLVQLPGPELDALVTPDRTHPNRSARFLESADGITVVIDTLSALAPPGIPLCVITPAADARYFHAEPRREELRRLVDATGESVILCYPGNVHPANAAEVRELYGAVLELNRGGTPARLIRTGRDEIELLAPWSQAVAPFVIDLGRIRKHRHVAPVLAVADLFIQPGENTTFNACRFPSKLPEFFAIGRPVILPRTNLGLRVRHGEDAWVLDRVDAAGISAAVRTILADRGLYDRLSRGAIAFAARALSWEEAGETLADFYDDLLGDPGSEPR